jgi:Anti-sigma factor NepR
MADKLRGIAEAERGLTAMQAGETGGASGSAPSLKTQDRRAQQRAISQGLRQFFDTVASEPIPDEFVELLKRIDEGKAGRSE